MPFVEIELVEPGGGLGVLIMLRVLLASSLLAAVAAASSPSSTAAAHIVEAEVDRGPNVLFVITDDQRRTGALKAMPATAEFFGAQGRTYKKAFATTPLCCPSRGTIFSGRYAHNHGVLANGATAAAKEFDKGPTLQRQLHDAGYNTAIFGKYFNAWPLVVDPANWDRWSILKQGYTNATFNDQGVMRERPGYTTDLIADDAIEALRGWESDDSRPWFLVVAPTAPHGPYTPRADHVDAPVPAFKANPAVFEDDLGDKPPWARSWRYDADQGRAVHDLQQRTLLSVDEMVGRLADRLDAFGEQDTIAFFISDNGLLLGEHKLGGTKRYPYNESVRIPLLMRWPGHVKADRVKKRLVGNADLMPTVLEAAGLTADPSVPLDGQSLFSAPARERILLEYFRSPESPAIPNWASTRTAKDQYIEWYDDEGNRIFREYYDLRADPHQLENLLGDGDRANDPPRRALARQLRADRDCVGPGCP